MIYLQMKLWQWIQANVQLRHLQWGKKTEHTPPTIIEWYDTETHRVVKANGVIILEEKL